MILQFPDFDALCLAITSGLVPTEVAAGPTAYAESAAGITVDVPAKVPRKVRNELNKLGGNEVRSHAGEPTDVSCWPQILPLVRTPAPPHLSTQAPVLFELQDDAALADVVRELIRLGNDRQSFRSLPGGRVLLRVVGPPYYTLLRALDRATLGGAVRAYAEAAPRVWVELGYSHPLADRVAVAEGQSLLVRPPREWEFLADEPFRDVYELLTLQLPAEPVVHAEAALAEKLTVPVRLVPGNAADEPEFWVLAGDPVDRLDSFVRDADERVLRRLRFAVATGRIGETFAILRVAPSKLPPPPLALDGATGYCSYWKLPNLFVPAGRRLHPPLRREAVRTLLAPDPDAVVWLAPDDRGFTPLSIPESAFRKLEDWVEYVIDREHQPLAEWVAAGTFDFEPFVCGESAVRPAPEPPVREKRPERVKREATVAPPAPESVPEPIPTTEPAPAAKPVPPSAWKKKRAELELAFLAVDGPLDHPDRVKLWPGLAAANAGVGDAAETAVAWSQAMWQAEKWPDGWLRSWAKAEIPDLTFPITEAAFDTRLEVKQPTQAEARQVVAVLLVAAAEKPTWLAGKLPAARAWLEAHDPQLPARWAWLAAVTLASQSGSDVLGLARSRDRLLQRLLDSGLNPDRDLPAFLRFAGGGEADRVREVREKASDLYGQVKSWLAKSLTPAAGDVTATPAYADLLFAFAFARFGDATRARELLRAGKAVLAGPPPPSAVPYWSITNGILARAFEARVEQVLAGVPPVGPFPQGILDDIHTHFERAGLDKPGQAVANSPDGMGHYTIARMREQSAILDPYESVDPKLLWSKQADEVRRQLAGLPLLRPDQLPREVRKLLTANRTTRPAAEVRFDVLAAALPLAPRAGEEFTVELLTLVPDAMGGATGADAAREQGKLLERALFLAGHFGRTELMEPLVDRFLELVAARKDIPGVAALVTAATGSGLRSLRKLGQKDAVDHLLQRLFAEVTRGESIGRLRVKYATNLKAWYDVLQALLRLAGGWLTFGLTDRAAPIADEARAQLLSAAPPGLPANSTTALARAYVAALGQGPADFGLPRLRELFLGIPPQRIQNSWTTAPVYSLNHVLVVEDAVLALTGDEFALGAAGKKWLDEDEFLVRKRVHADVRRLVQGAGL